MHFSLLTSQDVVRHRLVGDIVDAYEKWQVVQDNMDQNGQHHGPGARRGNQRRGR